MSTFTQIIYQIVFSTKDRQKVLVKNNRNELFKYINGVLAKKNCFLYVIGGVEDHIHILTHIHPTIALSGLVKDIKLSSSEFIKTNNVFPGFTGWQEGYGAFTYAIKDKQFLIDYIKNQEEHHKRITFKEEYLDFLKEHKIVFEEKYLL
jgi:REP element-mobilizing transposase RayT